MVCGLAGAFDRVRIVSGLSPQLPGGLLLCMFVAIVRRHRRNTFDTIDTGIVVRVIFEKETDRR